MHSCMCDVIREEEEKKMAVKHKTKVFEKYLKSISPVTNCNRRYTKKLQRKRRIKLFLLLKKKPFRGSTTRKERAKDQTWTRAFAVQRARIFFVVHRRKTRYSFSRLGEEISVQKSPEISADEFPGKKVRDREICSRRRVKLSLCSRGGFCSSSSRFITCVRKHTR